MTSVFARIMSGGFGAMGLPMGLLVANAREAAGEGDRYASALLSAIDSTAASVGRRVDAITPATFTAMRCPRCGEAAATFSGRSGTMTCRAGHETTRGSARAQATKGPPVAAPRPVRATKAVKGGIPSQPTRGGFAWDLCPNALPTDVAWHVRVAHARNQVARHGAVLAWLDKPIAQGGACDFRAESFCRELDAAKAAGARALLLTVDSRGGNVEEGLTAVAALEKFSREVGPTVAYVKGDAHSMAGVVAMAADYCVIAPGASMVVHAVHGGDTEDRRKLTNQLRAFLTRRTFLTESQADGMTASTAGVDFTFNAHEAVASGLADEVSTFDRAHEVARAASRVGWTASVVNGWRRRMLGERRK
jgi:ATP-dependent protease ClpP protease subunit